ncbi:ribonuclease H-like domain-containing protein [Tanacetum coccineum]
MSSNNSGSSNQAYGSNSANTNSISNAVIYSFLANQSNVVDGLEEMDLKWQMAMLPMRARRFLNKTGRKISANGSETIGFNKSKVECYNCHKRGHFVRECRALRENRNIEPVRRNVTVETTETKALVAQDRLGYDWSDQAEEGPKTLHLWHIHLHVLQFLQAQILRDNALTVLRKKFGKAEKERDDLKLTLEKFEISSKNLSKLLDIQVSDKFKTSVGYDSQVFDSQVFDSQMNDKYKSGERYHDVPHLLYTGTTCPLNLIWYLLDKDEYVFSESVTSISNNENENEIEFKSRQRKPSIAKVEFVKSNEHVKSPRESVKKGNPHQDLKDKGVIDSGCSRHMTGNKSYLTDYEDIDRGFVAFRGYSTNSKAFRVFNIRTRIVEENLHVQFSKTTPNIAESGPNWLFDIDALTKSINYKPVVSGNQSNGNAGTKAYDDADSEIPSTEEPRVNQEKDANINSTNNINTVSPTVNVVGIEDNVVD